MKIGVICEGPTDFVAIWAFLGHALKKFGMSPEFKDIQPNLYNSVLEGGWTLVLRWLGQNNLQDRRMRFFYGGLFAANSFPDVFDCLLVQIDTDILDKVVFQNHIRKYYPHIDLVNPAPREPKARASSVPILGVESTTSGHPN